MANILLVDDNVHIIQQAQFFLVRFGHSVDSITNPESLFPLLEKKKFDLILLDINFPETDGLTVLKKLKADPVHNNVPVVMLTGEANDQLLADCSENGAEDFINKPISELVLKTRVQTVLENRKHIHKINSQKGTVGNSFKT